MDVAHHQGFMEGSPSPTSCPTSPEARGLREQVREEGTGAHEDAIFLPTPHPYLKIAPLRPRSLPCCFILHPFQSYPRCQLIQRSRMLGGEGEGQEGVRRWKPPVQAPTDTLGNGSRQGGTQWPHCSPRSRTHGPDSDHRGVGIWRQGPGGLPHPGQSPGAGLGVGRVKWQRRAGRGGVPSLQAMASFPSSTQTAAGTGQGLLLKHWWLQALTISDAWGLRIFLGSLFLL